MSFLYYFLLIQVQCAYTLNQIHLRNDGNIKTDNIFGDGSSFLNAVNMDTDQTCNVQEAIENSCSSPLSCAGRCGLGRLDYRVIDGHRSFHPTQELIPLRLCSCDYLCGAYQDCCHDFYNECPSERSKFIKSYEQYLLKATHSCINGYKVFKDFPQETMLHTYSRLSPLELKKLRNHRFAENDPLESLPVSDAKTGISYLNRKVMMNSLNPKRELSEALSSIIYWREVAEFSNSMRPSSKEELSAFLKYGNIPTKIRPSASFFPPIDIVPRLCEEKDSLICDYNCLGIPLNPSLSDYKSECENFLHNITGKPENETHSINTEDFRVQRCTALCKAVNCKQVPYKSKDFHGLKITFEMSAKTRIVQLNHQALQATFEGWDEMVCTRSSDSVSWVDACANPSFRCAPDNYYFENYQRCAKPQSLIIMITSLSNETESQFEKLNATLMKTGNISFRKIFTANIAVTNSTTHSKLCIELDQLVLLNEIGFLDYETRLQRVVGNLIAETLTELSGWPIKLCYTTARGGIKGDDYDLKKRIEYMDHHLYSSYQYVCMWMDNPLVEKYRVSKGNGNCGCEQFVVIALTLASLILCS